MGTTDKTIGGTTKMSGRASGALIRLSNVIDFKDENLSSGEIISMLNIPANTVIMAVGAYVERAEGGTLTFDVGITGGDTDGFIDGADGNSVAAVYEVLTLQEATPNTVTGLSAGLLVTSASVLAMIINNDADYAKIHVHAYCLDLNP